jgi:hypothetical protein
VHYRQLHRTIGLPLHIGEVVSKSDALAVDAIERGLQFCFLCLEVLGSDLGTVMDLDDNFVQIGFGLARVIDFAAQMLEL